MRIPLKTGDEVDAFSRKTRHQRRNSRWLRRSVIKTGYARRLRHIMNREAQVEALGQLIPDQERTEKVLSARFT